MAYTKRTLVDGETVIDKDLLDHIQDGIIALDRALSGNLIAPESPTSAPAAWTYNEDGSWSVKDSNYSNLRFDADLPGNVTVTFSMHAEITSGGYQATIRDSSNTTLSTLQISNGENSFSYAVSTAGTYSFRLCGNTTTNEAVFTNFEVTYAEEENEAQADGLPAEYTEEAVAVGAECLDLKADLRILLFSDNHDYTPNKYKKYTSIMGQGVFDYSVGLGDYVDYSHIEKPLARAKLLASMNHAGRKQNQFYALGNHDVGICGVNAGTDDPDVAMSPRESFDVHCRHLKNGSGARFNAADPYGCYYFVDDEASKTRLIVLNTCDIFNRNPTEATEDMTFAEYQASAPFIRYYQQLRISQTQLDWIAHEALNLTAKENPSEWGVMLFGHWPNVYASSINSSNNILHSLLKAFKAGTSLEQTVSVARRLTMTDYGVYSKDIDTVTMDSYSVNVDYTEQGAGDIIGFFYGHDHVDTTSLADGIRYVEIRCDNSGVDDFYIAPWTEDIANETYYFYTPKGTIFSFTRTSSTPITDIGYIGFNYYWFAAGGTWPITVFDKDGLRKSSISGVTQVSEVPEGGIEITGFVRERGDSLVGEESCEVLCVDREARTLTFVPYGTATKRILTY